MTSEASSAPPDPSPSPRSTSLAAAATINAGTQAQEGRHTSGSFGRTDARGSASPTLRHSGPTRERRRSNVAMNISLNDPALPAPGELQTIGDNRPPSRTFRAASPQTISRSPSMADPHHHHRTPSIGELHQELEQEQEAQVNRLLQTIRQQQSQIHALQAQVGTPATTATGTEASPASERSFSFNANNTARTRSPVSQLANRSRRPSQASPAQPRGLPSGTGVSYTIPSSDESAILPSGTATPMGAVNASVGQKSNGGMDETAYYQAESQALTRENQILKTRIKELERQLSHSHGSPSHSAESSSNPSAPSAPSNLAIRSAVNRTPGDEDEVSRAHDTEMTS